MGWLNIALLCLTTLTIASTYHLQGHHEEGEDKSDGSEFGSKALPLREAVEALPNFIGLKSQPLRDAVEYMPRLLSGRIPLRDAVEHRVPPFFGGFDHDSIWIEPLAPPAIRNSQVSPNIVCRINSKAAHRREPFNFYSQSVPAEKCTHVIYSSATIDPNRLTVVSRDPEYDEVQGGYKGAVGLRRINPALRILISISPPRNLYEGLINESSYQRFVYSILEFLEEHRFDGVKIDFQDASTRELRNLLQNVYPVLSKKGYMVAVGLGPENEIDREIAKYCDFIDLRAWRELDNPRNAYHAAPLRYVDRLISRWLDHGVPGHKIILGVPLFGHSFTLKLANSTDAGAPVAGYGLGGEYTKFPGHLAYFEICEKLEDLWISGRDEDGAYLKRGDQWIAYDDPISIRLKMAYIRSAGLGGASLHSLDFDDFQGICGDPWPILSAASKTLGIINEPEGKCKNEGLFNDPDNCSGFISCFKGIQRRGNCGTGKFFNTANGRCVKASPEVCYPGHGDHVVSYGGSLTDLRNKQHKQELKLQEGESRVVCYVTSWALYRKGEGRFVPEHLDTRLCTDVVYAFAALNPDTLVIQPFDPWADIENNLYERITSIKGPRVLLALGGWTDSSGDKYSRLVRDVGPRRKFISSVVNFLKKHNFDGLSLEWNYPKCWQSDCNKGPDSDKPHFTKLVQELREEFDRQEPKLTLAVAVSGYKEVIDRAYEVDRLSRAADFLSVMSYDYHGAWEAKTGHLAPLYGNSDDPNPHYNVNFTLEYLVKLGAERSKLIAGVPFYGQAYRLSNSKFSDIGDPAAGPGSPGEFTRQPGMLAYYEICERIKERRWLTGPGPSAFLADQWVGFEDVRSVAEKGEYILRNGYGGATAWTVDLDDFNNRCCFESFPLLRSLNRALGRLLTPAPTKGNCERPEEPITPPPPTLTSHSDALDGDNHHHHSTKPIASSTTSKPTTWPTWTPKPSKKPSSTSSTTTWTWSEKPTTSKPSSTTWWWTPSTTKATTKAPTTVSLATTTEDFIEVGLGDNESSPGAPCSSGEHKEDPMNCANYYRCVLGQFKREQCAPGLHWDPKRYLCDWPASVKCQIGASPATNRPETTTRMTTVQAPTSTSSWATTSKPTKAPVKPVPAKPEKPTKACKHGEYYSYPDSCTSFLICVNGNLVSQQCGPGLNWNPAKKMCDWAFKYPCTEKPDKLNLLSSRDMDCVPGSFSSVPGDCESYRACLWGRHEVFQCAPGLHFNRNTHICDWPSRANCIVESTDSGAESTTAAAPSSSARPTRPPKPANDPPQTVPTTTRRPWTQSTKPHTTTTQATTTATAVSVPDQPSVGTPLSGHFKVVCYFTNWAWYRRGAGRYVPEDIDHNLCTHIVYGFAVLDYSELTIKAHDSWADYDNRFYERVVAYKQKGLKVLLALGGWNDSAGDKYSRLVNSASARRKFVEQALKFVTKFGFDGLDLDWEYPVCWQTECKKGPSSDKQGFSDLLRELSAAFKPKGLLLSSAVSPSKQIIDKGYDVPALAKYLDWIAVMTYDFHGQWDKRTGHVAPLYYHPDDEYFYFNANYSINYWISKGAPPRSIVMGMPLYGQSFSVNDPSAGTGLNSPASAGNAGEFTRAAGFLAYYEICDRIRNRGWTVVQDPQRRMGPYAYKGNQWVSFDDSDMIRQKAQFVRDMGLGGGMVWALDLDDFKGKCGEGPHPLMHTLQQVLAQPPNQHDRPIAPPPVGQELDWRLPSSPQSMSALTKPECVPTEAHQSAAESEFKVVCYFTNWAWYRQAGGKYVPEDIDPELCTHVIYGFAVLDGTSLTIKTHDPWADIDNKFYERVVAYKKKGIKVLVAIGGWNDSLGDKYSRLVNSPSARQRFITHVMQFIEKYGFEGLDLDWEYPVCWQVDCNKGPASDKEGFAAFVKELSEAFKPKGLLLSSAVSPSKRVINSGYDVPALAKYLDWISVMTYDFHGQWDKKTGHVAPLYVRPDDWEPTFNANFSIRYWIEQGAPPKKLVMGAPLYGQSFSLAERGATGLNVPTYGGGEAGEATRARGFLSYYEICERTLKKGWTVVQDAERRIGPYAYKGDQWVSFDDAEQIKLKSEFIKKMGLGGGMVWALDLDDFKNYCGCEPSPLLRTMNRVLRNYPDGPVCPISSSTVTESEPKPTTEKPLTSSQRPTTSTTSGWSPDTTDDSVEVEAGDPGAPAPAGDCDGRLFVPHKKDCSKYYLCNFGELSEQTCPNGLHWNENHCDWPENAKCRK